MPGRLRYCTAVLLLSIFAANSAPLVAQENGETMHAIIFPLQTLPQTMEATAELSISRQRLVLLAYQNAVAVYAGCTIVNDGSDSLRIAFGIPSEGMVTTFSGASIYSAPAYDPRARAAGENLPVRVRERDDAAWYIGHLNLAPQAATTVEAFFWVPAMNPLIDAEPLLDTVSILPGERHVLIALDGRRAERTGPGLDVRVVLTDGLIVNNCALQVSPHTYALTDSSVEWAAGTEDDIHCTYQTTRVDETGLTTLEALSEEMVERAYFRLEELAQTGRGD